MKGRASHDRRSLYFDSAGELHRWRRGDPREGDEKKGGTWKRDERQGRVGQGSAGSLGFHRQLFAIS